MNDMDNAFAKAFELETTGQRALKDAFSLALAMKALKNIPVISEEDVAENALTK
mgnify:CR=1 FL=1|tara:strand:- start:26 stop:187 length:162 start_codon:yes stop_codon:yes gene_type:complete